MNFERSSVIDQRTTNSSKTPWMIDNAGLIFIVFGLCSAGFYARVFKDLPFTEDPAQWGAFGSYVGGLLSPLVSIFTLVVAIKVWNTQKEELAATRTALEHSSDLMAEQLHSMEATRHAQMLDSCLADLRNAIAMVRSHFPGDAIRTDHGAVTTASKKLEESQPLVGMNSRAVTWVMTQQTPECKPELETWDWSIAHGNDAREHLRMMLPMCRNIGQALQVVALMPAVSQAFHFARVRNALSEWMLSTFTYFLVLHPDGQSLQGVSALGNVLRHLKIRRAQCFAQTYLPSAVWSNSPC
ncbi:MAG: hypothetical protein ABIR13_00820 [Polaromonas sp.]